jgi:hypothetical protein
MDQWTVKWTYQCTPDDGRVAAEIYAGLIEQKYEKKCISWFKKNWKLMSKAKFAKKFHMKSLRRVDFLGDISKTSPNTIQL